MWMFPTKPWFPRGCFIFELYSIHVDDVCVSLEHVMSRGIPAMSRGAYRWNLATWQPGNLASPPFVVGKS